MAKRTPTIQIPTHFYLMRRKWTVEITDEKIWENDHYCHGTCDPETKTVQVWGGLKLRRQLRTFVHEYLHAIEFEYKVSIPHRLVYRLEVPLAYLILIVTHGVE